MKEIFAIAPPFCFEKWKKSADHIHGPHVIDLHDGIGIASGIAST
jgi:hypothetical protein